MNAAQARSPLEQERQTLKKQRVVLDEQQPFRQRTTARIVWLGKVSSMGSGGAAETSLVAASATASASAPASKHTIRVRCEVMFMPL